MKGAARESRNVAIRRGVGERDQLETTERGCTAKRNDQTTASSECMGASKKRTVKAMVMMMMPWQGDCRNGRKRIKCV
jgi:hypothetical protein